MKNTLNCKYCNSGSLLKANIEVATCLYVLLFTQCDTYIVDVCNRGKPPSIKLLQ